MKKALKIITTFTVLILSFIIIDIKVYGAEKITYTDNKNGTVTVKYNNTDNVKSKIAVMKGESRYYYDMSSGSNYIQIPLTEGNGEYILVLCRNLAGNKYMTSDSVLIKLELADEKMVFLQSCQIIDWNEKNKAIKKAKSLTKKSKNDDSKINAIYEYVVKNYVYDYKKIESISSSSGYVPDLDDIYVAKSGICYDISSLMAGMLRSVKIPTQVVTGYTPNASRYHAWNEIYRSNKKKWIVVDATYDLQMYKAGKSYKMEKDRKYYKDVVYRY